MSDIYLNDPTVFQTSFDPVSQSFIVPASSPPSPDTGAYWGDLTIGQCIIASIIDYNPKGGPNHTGGFDHGAIGIDGLTSVGWDFLTGALVVLSQAVIKVNISEVAAVANDVMFAKAFASQDAAFATINVGYTAATAEKESAAAAVPISIISGGVGVGVGFGIALALAGSALPMAGLIIGAEGSFFASKIMAGALNYLVFTNGGQSALQYAENFLATPAALITDVSNDIKNIGNSVADLTKTLVNGAATYLENEFQQLKYDLQMKASSEITSIANLSGYYTGLAKYLFFKGDTADVNNIELNLQPQLATYAIDIGKTFSQTISTFGTLQAQVMSTITRVMADDAILKANPNNQGALIDAYKAEMMLLTANETARSQFLQIIQASNLDGATSSNFGTISPTTPMNGTITGTTGADILFGTSGADIFDGQGTSAGTFSSQGDVVIGGGGADTFEFNSGYGALEINEVDPSGTSSGTLLLNSSISQSMVIVKSTSNGSVLLTIGTSGDSVLIDDQLLGLQYGVSQVSFGGQSIWTRAQLAQFASAATTGSDVLYGTSASETFNGLGGNDTIVGGGGGDTFIFDRGYGTLQIDEEDSSATPSNILALGAGILPGDVAVNSNATGDIVLTISANGTVTGDVITLQGELVSARDGVQTVQFSNGMSWTEAQLKQFAATPTIGADNLYLPSAGTIDGLGGGDVIHGSGGGDTFTFASGYGSLEIDEQSSSGSASAATLNLRSGLSVATLSVTSDGSGDLLLGFSATDIVKIDNALQGLNYGIAKVVDSSGASLTTAQLIAIEENGAAGGLVINGTSHADTFTNLGKGDVVGGGGGGDVYDYASGAGSLTIYEADSNAANLNTINLAGISSTQATFALVSEGNVTGITISDGVTGDLVTLVGMASDPKQGVERIKFLGNNVTLTRDMVAALATGTLSITGVGTQSAPLQGGAGNNVITTTATDAYIASSGLFDTITSKFGSSHITLNANSSGLGHDASIALGRGHNVVSAADGNIFITGIAGSDQVTLGNGNSIVSGVGTANVISALAGKTTVTLGNASTSSSSDTVSLLSGGSVVLTGNNNIVMLGSASSTDSTAQGASAVTVYGVENSINAQNAFGETLGDKARSSGTTFTLTNPLGGSVTALGTSDMTFVSGGSVSVGDSGSGLQLGIANDSNVILSGFTEDAGALISLLPNEGYSSTANAIAALKSDGHGGSFLALGSAGAGINFVGTSLSSLQAFANNGTHFAVVSTLSNGWH